MAENIYSKGTRVWFEDKDHAWISAEVLSATKGTDDIIKLLFIDERGKVHLVSLLRYSTLISWDYSRRSPLIQQERRSRRERKVYHHFVIPLY
jgi:hypothetical protein